MTKPDPYQEALTDLERSEAWAFDLVSFALGALAVVALLGLIRLVRYRLAWHRANKAYQEEMRKR